MSGRRATVLAAAVAVAATGCVGPSRTDADYDDKAANTAESVASAVNTTRLGLDALARDKVTAAYLVRLVDEAEEDALAAQQALDAVQPPSDRADGVHDHLDELMTQALDALREVRLAVHRGHAADALAQTHALEKAAEALEDFEEHPS